MRSDVLLALDSRFAALELTPKSRMERVHRERSIRRYRRRVSDASVGTNAADHRRFLNPRESRDNFISLHGEKLKSPEREFVLRWLAKSSHDV